MNTAGRSMGRRWAALVVLGALVVVAAPSVPVSADHNPPPAGPVAGSGNVEGTEGTLEETYLPPACFQTTKIVMDLGGEGTYWGRLPDGSEVVYRAQLADGQPRREGPLRVEVENVTPYYHGPHGTHGADSTCGATAGTPIDGTFRIFAADHVYRLDGAGAQVPCTGTGTFARKGTSGDFHADWTLGADCTVVGNEVPGTGVAAAGTAMTHTGTWGPCFDVCTTNIRTDYAQYLPVEGLFVTVGGPRDGWVGNVVTVIAGVTDDGLAVTGAAVTFTVAGPAPAAPNGATAATDSTGRASFNFTAAVEGDYTVTASATSVSRPGQVPTADHTVTFRVPSPTMALNGPPTAQTEEKVVVMAKASERHDVANQWAALWGMVYDFTVTGPGQATPAEATVVSNYLGQAFFTFVADRAGDYTVTSTTTMPAGTATASHVVRLGVNTLKHTATLALGEDETGATAPVIDPAGRYAYFVTSSTRIVKVDLETFERVGTLALTGTGGAAVSGVMDPAGRYAYFGTASSPGRVVKVDLDTFAQVGVITLEAGEKDLRTAVMDPAGRYAYFTSYDATGAGSRVVRVDLVTFQRVSAVTLEEGEIVSTGVVEPAGRYAYFATVGAGYGVVKVDLAAFQRVGTIELPSDDGPPASAVIGPAGRFAYFGTGKSTVVKVDLATFQRVGNLAMPWPWTGGGDSSDQFGSAVIDPAGRYAYFGSRSVFRDPNSVLDTATSTTSPRVLRVDLETFRVAHAVTPEDHKALSTAVMSPDGAHAYFGTSSRGILKLSLTRPPAPWLAAAPDAYPTPYATPLTVAAPGVLANDSDTADGDPLTAHDASDPPHGSVVLDPDGSFTYTPDAGFSGTDTFTYLASDAMDYSAPATVSVTVDPPPSGVASVVASATGYRANVSLFGGPYEARGPAPVVTLAANASNSPQSAHLDTAEAVYGPATIFRSGPIDVSASGATGPSGHATTSATVAGHPDRDARPGPFLFDAVATTCAASRSATTTTTSVTNGVVETSYHVGDDPDTPEVEEGGQVRTTQAVPADPPANYVIEGALDHVGDRFRITFNRQVANPDGSTTVTGAWMELLGPTAVGEVEIAKSICGVELSAVATRAVADFDGDGASDVSVFRPASGAWYVEGRPTTYHGRDGDAAVPADYDGDGDSDIAVFRPSSGGWFVQGSPTTYHGRSGDLPVPGDYDGDGNADIAVFRPSSGGWYIAGQAPVFFGRSGDVPVPGDYDADGDTDIAVFRPSSGGWYVQGQPTTYHGRNGDVPVPGDYDGDGDTDIAVFRPSSGGWYVEGQPTVFLGRSGDVPVPGNYDGDGDTDIAVFRPSTGGWYVHGRPTVYLGRSGDVPLPLPAAVYRSMP